MTKEVYIDEYGWLSNKEEAKYKVTLSGAYEWNYGLEAWNYEVEKVEPALRIKNISSRKMLFENEFTKLEYKNS